MEGSGAPPGAIHPAIEPLSFLLGKWRGHGEGGFPTINSFSYGEELLFSHSGKKPVIAYAQKTWKLSSGEPMHAESASRAPIYLLECALADFISIHRFRHLNQYHSFKYKALIAFLDTAETQIWSTLVTGKGKYNAEEKSITLQSELVGNASKVTALLEAMESFLCDYYWCKYRVKEITRVFELKDGELSYVVQMATNLTRLEPHLKAVLKKL
ncbi:hypothetical protein TIFTF001_024641 [Ficus carica]|uniref:THAP4-like heme-binding domain-containing protein n=1 Tax=Ficus carica TaxID=3494 RepID=A0AA88AVY9_FICCA|nr:hypothetical protein TIFTF001_024641 [Ficus carica]